MFMRMVAVGFVAWAFSSSLCEAGGFERFTNLPLWDDGLSEMSYYDAVETIYGKERHYTRVQLFNRQFMGAASGVKVEAGAADAVPVFKFNIAEEIPTPNYNYRYLTTVFLRRENLKPFKMVVSSQEWCGTTFKHLRWSSSGLKLQSFSYFGNEGDQVSDLPAEAVPLEGLFVVARAVAAAGEPYELRVLAPLRNTHGAKPVVHDARLIPASATSSTVVPGGTFTVRRVELSADGLTAWFEVEAEAPYRLIAFSAAGVTAELHFSERRAYWDRRRGSGYYARNQAP